VCRAKACALAKSDPPTTGPSSDKKPPKRTHYVQEQPEQEDNSSGDEYSLNAIHDEHSSPCTITLHINNTPVKMEVDTGAAVSIINEATFHRVQQSSCASCTLEPVSGKLKTYTGQDIAVLGAAQFIIRYKSTQLYLAVHVVSRTGPNLLGRDLITPLGVDLDNLKQIRSLKLASPLEELLDKHAPVFSQGLGCFNGPPVKLNVDANAQPKFYKARNVPFALKNKVEAELADLQSKGIISPIKHSDWAAPIVPVLKKNGKVRICGDYKLTINQAAPTETYPLPRIEELLAAMSGGKYFSKLDLRDAYLQLPLDTASKQYVTINTHRGLFQYNRLHLAWHQLRLFSSATWKCFSRAWMELAFTLMISWLLVVHLMSI